MTEVSECIFLQNTVYCASHCKAAHRERGLFFLSGMLHYGPGTTSLEMEVGVVFNPYLEQLSLRTTKTLRIRRVKKAKSSTGGCSHKYTSRDAHRWWREGDFPVDTEETVLFPQFGKLLDITGLKSKTERRHYLLLKLILL